MSTYVTYNATLSINPKNRSMAVINFADGALTDEGSYTITIPEASVGDQLWYESEGMTGKSNATINLYFTIGKEQGGNEDSDWTTDPENGSTIASLHEIHVWNNTTQEMGSGSGKAVLKRDGMELEKIADASWGDDLNELVLTTSKEYTEEGVYTLEIPEGFFLDGFGDALPAVTFTWGIGVAVGVNDIAAERNQVVFTLDGRKANASQRGIVIVGSKKVLKK